MRTLIVEDEPAIRQLVKIMIKSYGHCVTAANGGEAVMKFQTAINQERPFDLVIMDIMMPVMDGLGALEKIRKTERELGIKEVDGVKVIMLTARDDAPHIVKSFKKQCDAYITKPFEENELLDEIKRLNLMKADHG